jgi:hypothetical protein
MRQLLSDLRSVAGPLMWSWIITMWVLWGCWAGLRIAGERRGPAELAAWQVAYISGIALLATVFVVALLSLLMPSIPAEKGPRNESTLPENWGPTAGWADELLALTVGNEQWALRAWNMMRVWSPGWGEFSQQARQAVQWTRGLE